MNLPSISKCFELMAETKMLDNIKVHSIMVSKVAILLAQYMRQAGIPLSLELIETAALLHDITKTRSLQTGERHSRTGARFLRSLGYPEVASVVLQHVRLSRYSDSSLPSPSEIVNYADKRVLHDQITDLAERMRYIEERYGADDKKRQRIQLLWRDSVRLEQKLFRFLPFEPHELPDLLRPK